MDAAGQVEYESRVRLRYAVIAVIAGVLVVASQVIRLTGVQAPVSELTLALIAANKRATPDIIGAVADALGLISVGVLFHWLHQIAAARHPSFRTAARWITSAGVLISAVMAIASTVVIIHKAHEFVTSGNQGYPEASQMTSAGLVVVLPLVLELGTLLLAIGIVWVSLGVMRVGLVTRVVGYAGVVAGALFVFPIGVIVPIVQGFWLASLAVLLARRWPGGDPAAWAAGVSVPWTPVGADAPRPARPPRGQRRRRVSDREVLAAVDDDQKPANPRAGKRKRKRH